MDAEGQDESDDDRDDRSFPMPALSAMQMGGRQPQQVLSSLPIVSSSGGPTLMLRSLLTGANVPVVASGAVAPGVISQTTPVTLEPTDPALPPDDERTGE